MTKVTAETPVASFLARTACGTVFVTASPRSTSPRLSFPRAVAVPRIAAAHTPAHGDGGRWSRRPAATAIVAQSVAPIPDDQAASPRPARTA